MLNWTFDDIHDTTVIEQASYGEQAGKITCSGMDHAGLDALPMEEWMHRDATIANHPCSLTNAPLGRESIVRFTSYLPSIDPMSGTQHSPAET